ncbi:PTS sugar transporter subunit IIA [Lactobacillus delbrueckii]|uniref:PTS sugar transporter subunit IIA n=1 Tax=Lactobacillus delbrueckii TaxID=1584 RepID=UPI0021A3DCF6|nr:PTS sugar transporter subunit IIA [Lactobacillus delbrueckii]MCT3509511.1 PTS sugar transporter subunit IIA [Lactobacillus delbrueckii subsp. bulgaricus]
MSADLVICVGETIDWQGEVVEISPFVNFNDINVIQQACVRIRHRKLQDGITSELETFFKPEFFYYGRDLANRDAALEKIASCFTQAGVTDASYLTKLKKREELSSTAFGKVAIPHSFNMVALKSRGYILVNPTGIEWGQNAKVYNAKVYVVIGLAIDPQNTSLFREVFDKISEVMVDEENISQLIQCTTYDQFIDQLISLL